MKIEWKYLKYCFNEMVYRNCLLAINFLTDNAIKSNYLNGFFFQLFILLNQLLHRHSIWCQITSYICVNVGKKKDEHENYDYIQKSLFLYFNLQAGYKHIFVFIIKHNVKSMCCTIVQTSSQCPSYSFLGHNKSTR